MKKMTLVPTAVLFSLAATNAFADPYYPFPAFGVGDAQSAVVCSLNDVKVLTVSPGDCQKIGGAATHTVAQSVTPIAK